MTYTRVLYHRWIALFGPDVVMKVHFCTNFPARGHVIPVSDYLEVMSPIYRGITVAFLSSCIDFPTFPERRDHSGRPGVFYFVVRSF